MRYAARILSACGVLLLLATPAWAHPSPELHVHGGALAPLLALAVVLGAVLLLRRFRSRAG